MAGEEYIIKQGIIQVNFLGNSLGENYEIALFDLREESFPMISACNMNEVLEDKVRSFIRELLHSRRIEVTPYYCNRPISVAYNKMSKMSAMILSTEEGKPVAALCVGMNCDILFRMQGFTANLLNFNTADLNEMPETESELTSKVSLDKIGEYMAENGIEPGRISADDKLDFICELYDMGFFNLKGAVATAAEAMQISSKSIYSYLTKIKKARE